MDAHRKQVLVVEDEEDARSMLALSLEHAGYSVRMAGDGVEALKEMKHQRFDAVVTDYQMPRLNGLEFLSLSKIVWPDTPVVMVSGDRSDVVADLAMHGGAFAWVHKPFERAFLLQILRVASQQSAEERTHLATSRTANNEARDGWRSGQP